MDQRPDRESWKGREVLRLLELTCNERKYFQEIIASLPIPLAVVGSDGEFLTANRSFRELFQIRTGDQSLRCTDLFASAELQSAIQSAVRFGSSHPDLSVGPHVQSLKICVTPLRGWGDDAEREALLTVGATPGLPQTATAEPTGRFPAVIWSLDPESLRFTEITGDCEELFGAPRDHWLGEGTVAPDRIHASYRSAVTNFYRKAITTGGDFSCQFRTATDPRKEKWSRDSFRVLRQPDGRVRVAGVTIDVTGRRKADEHAIQANRADALVGLSRRLTHDLNNALMVVSGYGEELLAHFGDQDPRRADVEALMSAAETIAGIAGELQGFTRTQSSPTSTLAVGEILETVSTRIRSQLGAVLVTRLLDETLFVSAESAQLEAVLLSLARALRHTADPHMILTAGHKRVSDFAGTPFAPEPGEYVEIVFRAPVDSDLEPHAFENLLSGRDPHGADLARAYAIVRGWGGWIRAARTDHSTEVRLMLPAAGTAASEPEPSPSPQLLPEVAPEPVRSTAETILVVEDEQGIRNLVRRILDREGYDVLDASSAEEADDAIRRSPGTLALLITDIHLPGVSGHQLAERLTDQIPHLRTIYMSGYSENAALPTPVSPSGGGFLQKPFTRSALINKVREALAEARQLSV
jgi:CheY-like chemotaxis protein/PAS domain-containing protein/nitrogen-specific signal transduction histidine kinase